MDDFITLKDAFRNSGLLVKPKHAMYYHQGVGTCAPFCRACKLENEKAPPCLKCGEPWNGKWCDHE